MKGSFVGLGAVLCAMAVAHAADDVQLRFAGAAASENFAPNRAVDVRDLGMLAGRDQFSVIWVMATSTYGNPDYKRLVFGVTAPKDGVAIQGLILDFDRAKETAIYQPRCVLNTMEGCDIRAEGIDLDVKSKTIRFTNAKFLLKSKKPFPPDVVVNGVLKY